MTTQPHPEPSEEASSLTVYAFHLLWPDDANGIAWNEWYEADDETRPTEWDDDVSPEECIAVVRLSDAKAIIDTLRAELARLEAQHKRDMEAVEWCTAGAQQIIAERNAAREALRASLVAHKAANVSDNGTCDPSVSHNARAAATMAQLKETP